MTVTFYDGLSICDLEEHNWVKDLGREVSTGIHEVIKRCKRCDEIEEL